MDLVRKVKAVNIENTGGVPGEDKFGLKVTSLSMEVSMQALEALNVTPL